ncbi:MAG: PilZ domain-containing protein [Candidatus Omnitrophica bacterium]|nr:PilZ domain-containing protein [Candidatus Omnitrophota bacterium]
MTTKSNRRKSRRQQCAVPVDGNDQTNFGQMQTFDISKGGIGFISHQKIPLNQEIAVELDLKEGEDPVLAIGKVVWVEKIPDSANYRIGLTFEDLRRGSKSRLNEYFRKKSAARYR